MRLLDAFYTSNNPVSRIRDVFCLTDFKRQVKLYLINVKNLFVLDTLCISILFFLLNKKLYNLNIHIIILHLF